MGRLTDQDVHAAFVEFRAKEDDKCLSVQCIYCHQTRAKNTSRQKAHLLECPGLQNHPAAGANRPPTSSSADLGEASTGYGTAPALNGAVNAIHTAVNTLNGTPMRTTLSSTPLQNRPSISQDPSFGGPLSNTDGTPQLSKSTPKPKSTPKYPSGSNIPAPALDDVHAAFVEFRAKNEDKCLSVQCMYCSQVRAKNTSRQRAHLLECPAYLNVMKDSIPANNLLHRFDEGEVARSLQLPAPTLDLDFRLSIKVNPKVMIGPTTSGQQQWISFIGGQWAGRWGKGIVIPGGQDCHTVQKDHVTLLNARFLIGTSDEPPVYITVKYRGKWIGGRDVMEQIVAEPDSADHIAADRYKFRVNLELESGDDRYSFLNEGMWVGSGSRRVNELVIDAYRVG